MRHANSFLAVTLTLAVSVLSAEQLQYVATNGDDAGDGRPGGEARDFEKAMSKETVQEVRGIVALYVDSKCTVGRFRQALRMFYDGGYKPVWVFFDKETGR